MFSVVPFKSHMSTIVYGWSDIVVTRITYEKLKMLLSYSCLYIYAAKLR